MSPERIEHKNSQPTPQEVLEAGQDLLDHFGVSVDPKQDPEKFREALSQLDPRYQGGRDLVRFELESDQTQWDEDTKSVIMKSAEGMRMLEHETPLAGQYDLVIALGGARQSNLDRTRYAAETTANIENIVVAGSLRKLNDAEKENASNYAPGAETEASLCAAAAKVVKGEHPELQIRAIPTPGEKAGTPDVLEHIFDFMYHRGQISEGSRVAAVTTQIYQASTSLDIARIGKKYGLETMAAGNPSDPKVIEARTPATYLSEVLRTMKAATLALEAKKQ
jgi:hypothetical protein